MVVDEGIDPSVPELQGKIAAVYTELCADGGGGDGSLIPDGGRWTAGRSSIR